MTKFTRFLLGGIISSLAMASCIDQSPQNKAKKSVQKYLSDSLTNVKVKLVEISKFDTITKFDSLTNVLNYANENIMYAKEQLNEIHHNKQQFESLSALASIFPNKENQEKIEVANKNIEITINNLQHGLKNYEIVKETIIKNLKDDGLKNIISGYLVIGKYHNNGDTISESFQLNPSFNVINKK